MPLDRQERHAHGQTAQEPLSNGQTLMIRRAPLGSSSVFASSILCSRRQETGNGIHQIGIPCSLTRTHRAPLSQPPFDQTQNTSSSAPARLFGTRRHISNQTIHARHQQVALPNSPALASRPPPAPGSHPSSVCPNRQPDPELEPSPPRRQNLGTKFRGEAAACWIFPSRCFRC